MADPEPKEIVTIQKPVPEASVMEKEDSFSPVGDNIPVAKKNRKPWAPKFREETPLKYNMIVSRRFLSNTTQKIRAVIIETEFDKQEIYLAITDLTLYIGASSWPWHNTPESRLYMRHRLSDRSRMNWIPLSGLKLLIPKILQSKATASYNIKDFEDLKNDIAILGNYTPDIPQESAEEKSPSNKIRIEDKPPSKKIRIEDENPPSKKVRVEDEKPPSNKIRIEDKPPSKKIRIENENPPSKKVRIEDTKKPPEERIEITSSPASEESNLDFEASPFNTNMPPSSTSFGIFGDTRAEARSAYIGDVLEGWLSLPYEKQTLITRAFLTPVSELHIMHNMLHLWKKFDAYTQIEIANKCRRLLLE
jgi:hypothetical protein